MNKSNVPSDFQTTKQSGPQIIVSVYKGYNPSQTQNKLEVLLVSRFTDTKALQ